MPARLAPLSRLCRSAIGRGRQQEVALGPIRLTTPHNRGCAPHLRAFIHGAPPVVTEIGILLLWLSAILTLYTGWDYMRAGLQYMVDE